MNDLKISELMKMQNDLFELHKDEWTPIESKYGKDFLLYMIEEMGECIAIIKKKGENNIMNNENVRQAFTEEMSDVLCYFIDTLLRYGITYEEICKAYILKHNKNMGRNYIEEYKDKYES